MLIRLLCLLNYTLVVLVFQRNFSFHHVVELLPEVVHNFFFPVSFNISKFYSGVSSFVHEMNNLFPFFFISLTTDFLILLDIFNSTSQRDRYFFVSLFTYVKLQIYITVMLHYILFHTMPNGLKVVQIVLKVLLNIFKVNTTTEDKYNRTKG